MSRRRYIVPSEGTDAAPHSPVAQSVANTAESVVMSTATGPEGGRRSTGWAAGVAYARNVVGGLGRVRN